ncbi:hypothetical protein CPLU01_07550 [Colletotrichum plurivorum]|uniref:Uncharacterized protein n=1 Tax=Colletotrichum plurivorum TaxID=2175906 RepID=A0A8H6NEZ1_9PEZI|nr:hypothetical protein CPLU01_07550 [Colletotrichum plurivorum]
MPQATVHVPTPVDLTHSAAMSASLNLQILLALQHMTPAQYTAARDDQLTSLPPRFSAGTIARNAAVETSIARPGNPASVVVPGPRLGTPQPCPQRPSEAHLSQCGCHGLR